MCSDTSIASPGDNSPSTKATSFSCEILSHIFSVTALSPFVTAFLPKLFVRRKGACVQFPALVPKFAQFQLRSAHNNILTPTGPAAICSFVPTLV
jgi:hypothetical protein